jgi:Protein of unknown function (DUF2510)
MAVRESSSGRWAFWTCAGLCVFLTGLVMTVHERKPHDSCIVSTYLLGHGISQPTPSCGFVDTVYWSGIVLVIGGALFALASGGTAISISAKTGGTFAGVHSKLARTWLSVVAKTPSPRRKGVYFDNPPTIVSRRSEHSATFPSQAVSAPTLILERPAPPEEAVALQRQITAPPLAAWYPDPDDQGRIRWWDGTAWGESRPIRR